MPNLSYGWELPRDPTYGKDKMPSSTGIKIPVVKKRDLLQEALKASDERLARRYSSSTSVQAPAIPAPSTSVQAPAIPAPSSQVSTNTRTPELASPPPIVGEPPSARPDYYPGWGPYTPGRAAVTSTGGTGSGAGAFTREAGTANPSFIGLQQAATGDNAALPAFLGGPGALRQGIGTRSLPLNASALAGLRRVY